MLTMLLPLLSLAVGASGSRSAPDPDAVATTPRVAQVRLAETLAGAQAIHAIRGHGRTVSFAIDRDGEALRIDATTRRSGEVIALTITDVGPALGDLGSLSWLGDELADSTAITTLGIDEDGAVTLTTNDGRAYMAIPGRGSGGNVAAEARWAAAWSADAS